MVGMDQKDRSGLLLCQGCIIPGCPADIIEVGTVKIWYVLPVNVQCFCVQTPWYVVLMAVQFFFVPGVHRSRTGRGPH